MVEFDCCLPSSPPQLIAPLVQEAAGQAAAAQQLEPDSLWACTVAAYARFVRANAPLEVLQHVTDQLAGSRAQKSGAAFMTDTEGELMRDPLTGVDFVLRVSTALRQKPSGEKHAGCAWAHLSANHNATPSKLAMSRPACGRRSAHTTARFCLAFFFEMLPLASTQ